MTMIAESGSRALSLSEFQAVHPHDPDKKVWYRDRSISEIAAAVPGLHAAPEPVAYLEQLKHDEEKEGVRSADIASLLLFLPPEEVINNFGEQTAIWAALNSIFSHENDGMMKVLQQRFGHDPQALEIARGWDWRRGERFGHPTRQTLALYGLMMAMRQGGILEAIDVPSIVMSSAREGVVLSARRVDDYGLIPIEAEDYNSYYDAGHVKGWSDEISDDLAFGMYIDAPTGFALTYKGLPNAMAAFSMRGENEILLQQMQGVQARRIDRTKGRYEGGRYADKVASRGLMPLDWQKVIVEVTEAIAVQRSANKIGILAAKNNVWIKPRFPSDKEAHLPLEAAIKAYDVPARRLGFHQEADDRQGNWHRPIVAPMIDK